MEELMNSPMTRIKFRLLSWILAGLTFIICFSFWQYRSIQSSDLISSTSFSVSVDSSGFNTDSSRETELVQLLMSLSLKRANTRHYANARYRIWFVGSNNGDTEFMNLIIGTSPDALYLEYRNGTHRQYTIYKVLNSEKYYDDILALLASG